MCNTIGLTEEEYNSLMDENQYRSMMTGDLFYAIQEGLAGDQDAMMDAIDLLIEEGILGRHPYSVLGKIYFSFLKQLVDAGSDEDNTYRLINLGLAYEGGIGGYLDGNEAIRCYQRVAKTGHSIGNEHLGMIYLFGHCVPVDYEKAFHYFTIDNDHQSVGTDYYIGEMYRQGLYIKKDEEVACRYYEKKVYDDDISSSDRIKDETYWRACYRLGMAKHYGWGTEKNLEEALRLLNDAKKYRDSLLDITDDSILTRTNNLSLDIINDVTEEELNHELELINQETENSK